MLKDTKYLKANNLDDDWLDDELVYRNTPQIINPYATSFNSLPPQNPLTAAANNSPMVFENTVARILHVNRVDKRNETMQIISSHHRDEVCTWLASRQAGEKVIEIASGGGGRSRAIFGEGEEVALKTVVRISGGR